MELAAFGEKGFFVGSYTPIPFSREYVWEPTFLWLSAEQNKPV